jgi:response regulator RpfG family c-di-GMP phosphodiesterase
MTTHEVLQQPETRRALVLLVDAKVESRHWLWRTLSQAFGVIEAASAAAARRWIRERPDIDAIIVDDELPDARGHELVGELAREANPIAGRAIVVAAHAAEIAPNVVEPGDVCAILSKLTGWLVGRDVAAARALLREFTRFPASARRVRVS